jgi:hypothetical protein
MDDYEAVQENLEKHMKALSDKKTKEKFKIIE